MDLQSRYMRLMTHELIIRLGGLLGAFFLFAILESLLPDRARVLTRQQRWPGAWLLMFVSAVGARLILPVGLAGVALWAQAHHVGLFHQVDLPIWLEIVLAMLLLDLAVQFRRVWELLLAWGSLRHGWKAVSMMGWFGKPYSGTKTSSSQ